MAKDKLVQGKHVQIDGVEYYMPEGYDQKQFMKQLELEKGIVGGLAETEEAARGAIGSLEAEKGSSITELRRQGAQALATQRGLTSGGRGLSLARSTGKDIGTREASLRSKYAKDISAAKKEAAATGVSRKVEESKLLEAQTARKESANVARTEVEGIIADEQGSLWTNQADRDRMVKRLRSKLAAASNPYEAEVYQGAINQLITTKDTKGSLDIEFSEAELLKEAAKLS